MIQIFNAAVERMQSFNYLFTEYLIQKGVKREYRCSLTMSRLLSFQSIGCMPPFYSLLKTEQEKSNFKKHAVLILARVIAIDVFEQEGDKKLVGILKSNESAFLRMFGLRGSVGHELYLAVFNLTREHEAKNKTNIFGEIFIDHVQNYFSDTTKVENLEA